MEEVYLVYETDIWHSVASSELVGVFTSREQAIDAVIRHIEEDYTIEEKNDIVSQWGCDVEDEDDFDDIFQDFLVSIRKELASRGQTQGYTTNYIISCVDLNKWL